MKLELQNITKSFGEKEVLKNISLSAESGCALGLLGRNGAGKTTTIRIAMGVFPADSGSVSLDGRRVSDSGAAFGYLPEERGLYPKKSILSQLSYLGQLRGMRSADARQAAIRWVERVGLSEYLNKPLSTLSKGNQQKIQLASTLLHNPDIVILDEPFSGLDPVNAQLLKEIVSDLVKNQKIVIFSSHQMGYVEEFCENIAILNQGNIVLSGNLREIKHSYPRNRIYLETDGSSANPETIRQVLDQAGVLGLVVQILPFRSGYALTLSDAQQSRLILKALADSVLPIEKFEVIEPTLEQIFVEKAGETI
ncbi:MAG TPA: ATP-binding cassette domain-containing protein [Firmicutes bacterium]|nr:ATP-binding cassette domain-containing protein [Bacillota bacterium]